MLIKKHLITEAFSFAQWQRLGELGLGDGELASRRIELSHTLLSDRVDEDQFKQKLVELGLVIINVKIHRSQYSPLNQTIALVGPPEAFDELDRWWLEQTGRNCPLHLHLGSHHTNSQLVRDRWTSAVEAGEPFTYGAFNEIGARL